MKIIKFLKNNILMSFILVAYGLLFIFKFNYGIESVKNSLYYIKEMLMIMPVVFVLTALLDTWVPKETIIKYLGEGSRIKGMFFAFLLGSISAGPIYAAFPICILLLRKGATVKNIVIILSAWAVIKIPMLINEVAFLGIKFMTIRWFLTIIAIVVFSIITDKIVKKEDMPLEKDTDEAFVKVNVKACIGCGLCKKKYPEIFEIKNKKAFVIIDDANKVDEELSNNLVNICPMKAISCN